MWSVLFLIFKTADAKMLSQSQPFKFILKLLQIFGIDYKDLSFSKRVFAFYCFAQYLCFIFLVVLQAFFDSQQAAMMEKLANGVSASIGILRGTFLCFKFGEFKNLLNQIDEIFDGHENCLDKVLIRSTTLAKIQFGFVYMSIFMLALSMLITGELAMHPYEFDFVKGSAIKFPFLFLQNILNMTYFLTVLNAIDFLPTFIMMTFSAYLEFLNKKFTRITFVKGQRAMGFIEAIEMCEQFKK